MSTLKINFGEVLSRKQMKNVLGGQMLESEGFDGDCQSHGDECSTAETKNCCSGMVCADYKCAYPTSIT